MAPSRPPTTGYARLAQAEHLSDDEEDHLANSRTSLPPISAPYYASITQPSQHAGMHTDGFTSPRSIPRPRDRRRMRSNSSGVDIKAINARLEKWADEIASKFRIGKAKAMTGVEEGLEIQYSVFQPPDGMRPATAETMVSEPEHDRMSKADFEAVVEGVRLAIEQGMHPKMISQGSSGSYFARSSDGKVVGVFKPKDEEPYAAGNPKWNKWIHRNLFPCFFGRACLIPNLSYVSEAAAYTLDRRLRTNLVPYTDIVHISSTSFHYDFWDRRTFYRKKKLLPPKVGSFQLFLKGFVDANIFLRDNPWPDHLMREPSDPSVRKTKGWRETCQTGSSAADDADTETNSPSMSADGADEPKFVWTNALQQSFREELEKLVILDYIMRNTDRGLNNWMVKIDWDSPQDPLAARSDLTTPSHACETLDRGSPGTEDKAIPQHSYPYKVQEPMGGMIAKEAEARIPKISIGAIDNSLSWPWKHPDAWRSFPFGWLFLPVSLIGRPFSQKTRDHFLPILTSKHWWTETQLELRKVFKQDVDFQERMFARQIAVMKGQAWNVVEALKTPDHGPLELTRRARVCVWDDLVDIPVAVPLRVPSAEMRRRHDPGQGLDEMDISTAIFPPQQQDLLSLATAPNDLPNPHRFDLANARQSEDTNGSQLESIPSLHGASPEESNVKSGQVKFSESSRPTHFPSQSSYDGPLNTPFNTRRKNRRFSFSSKSRGAAQMLYNGDDLEGDLGYAAAEGMEGNHRKVIVERLETVKSKNPVFTWC